MAEGTQTASEAPAAAAAVAVEVVVTAAEEEKSAVEAASPAPAAEAKEENEKPAEAAATEGEKNAVADLEDLQKKALDELKLLVQAALANNEFTKPPAPVPKEEKADQKAEGVAAAAATEKVKEPVAEAPKAKEAAAKATKADEPTAEVPDKVDVEAPEVETKEVDTPKTKEAAPPFEEVTGAVAEKAVVVDEDGAKTVEATKETVVPVAVVATPQPPAEVIPPPAPAEKATPPPPQEVLLWGVPLLGDVKSDTILLKFLRARDFKVKDALAMLKDAVIWREEFGMEKLILDENLGVPGLEKVVFMHGHDKEGHPVCYNVYGEFQDRELYQKVFSDEEKRKGFLRWRIQFLEKGIRQQLDFSPSGVCSMVQVTDLKNSPGFLKRELRHATKQALALLQDNYPEFVAKQVFINVPWWYLVFNRMISPFLTQRTKSKFVFAGPSRSFDTLFKHIAPEQVPVQYGGLSKENDSDFGTFDAVTEITIKPSTKHAIEIPVSESSCLLVWELRVLGWDVSYGAEFVPSAEDGYTVIVQKARKFVPADELFVKNSFKIGEPGKIVLTIDNSTSRKKQLLYRSKSRSATDSI